MFWLLQVRQGKTWNEEITRKQDGYVHLSAVQWSLTEAEAKSRPLPTYHSSQEQLQSLPCPEVQYKRFAGITSSVQWDCNMIFHLWVKVRRTLCGAPADCSVPSPIITRGLSNRGECLMGFYVKHSDAQKETTGISLSCQWLRMRSPICTLILIERAFIIELLAISQFGDEKTETIAALSTLALNDLIADFFMRQILVTALCKPNFNKEKSHRNVRNKPTSTDLGNSLRQAGNLYFLLGFEAKLKGFKNTLWQYFRWEPQHGTALGLYCCCDLDLSGS